VIVYGVVSLYAWKRLSADLTDVMTRIESSTTGGGQR
jgi:hypothetical protein